MCKSIKISLKCKNMNLKISTFAVEERIITKLHYFCSSLIIIPVNYTS